MVAFGATVHQLLLLDQLGEYIPQLHLLVQRGHHGLVVVLDVELVLAHHVVKGHMHVSIARCRRTKSLHHEAAVHLATPHAVVVGGLEVSHPCLCSHVRG